MMKIPFKGARIDAYIISQQVRTNRNILQHELEVIRIFISEHKHVFFFVFFLPLSFAQLCVVLLLVVFTQVL